MFLNVHLTCISRTRANGQAKPSSLNYSRIKLKLKNDFSTRKERRRKGRKKERKEEARMKATRAERSQ